MTEIKKWSRTNKKNKRIDEKAPNWQGGIYKGREREYHKDYARDKLIYNKFTGSHQPSTSLPCPAGFDRHHIFYVKEDINIGFICITRKEHMRIEIAIRKCGRVPIPVMSMDTYLSLNETDPKLALIKYIQMYTKTLDNWI